MRALLIGFGPFPGAPVNPSALIVAALARRRRPALAPIERRVHIFATRYDSVDRDLPPLFAGKPDLVLLFGVAARRRQVCIETRAHNALSVLFPDAGGMRPDKGKIDPVGPRERAGRAAFAPLLASLRAGRVPARLSHDAGRYLCNYAYWRALQQASGRKPLVQLVHIPQVACKPLPHRKGGKSGADLSRLVAAAERLLIALAAESKH